MSRHPTSDPSSDMAYLRPLVRRLGPDEVHRLVDLIAVERPDPNEEPDAAE